MTDFPPLNERPCYQRPPDRNGHHSCMLPQDQCVCYQETLAREKAFRTKLLIGFVVALACAASSLFFVFTR